MNIEYYPHRSSFNESKKDKKKFNFLQDVLFYVVKNSELATGLKPFTIEDIFITHYCYDLRVKNECFALCVGKYLNEDFLKKYNSPQIIGYLYFDELKTDLEKSTFRFINSLSGKTMSVQNLLHFFIDSCYIPEENLKVFKKYVCYVEN